MSVPVEYSPWQLTIHADRSSSMTSKPVAFMLADLGVTKTCNRPHVYDNPFSESQLEPVQNLEGIGRSFQNASAPCSMPEAFARNSSPGTTPSIMIQGDCRRS